MKKKSRFLNLQEIFEEVNDGAGNEASFVLFKEDKPEKAGAAVVAVKDGPEAAGAVVTEEKRPVGLVNSLNVFESAGAIPVEDKLEPGNKLNEEEGLVEELFVSKPAFKGSELIWVAAAGFEVGLNEGKPVAEKFGFELERFGKEVETEEFEEVKEEVAAGGNRLGAA